MLQDYLWTGAATYVSLWLNTLAAVQMLFIERIFVFFMTLFLKKMGIIWGTSQPQSHFRLSKPILKILSIYEKNILGKQLFLAICSKCIFRLLHAPKFQIFSTKLKMMVKVVKLFTRVLWKRCSDNFIGKHLRRSLFFNKVSRLQAKERLLHIWFPVSFTKYFRTLFFAKHLWVTTFAKYPFFVRYVAQPKKRFLQPWLF